MNCYEGICKHKLDNGNCRVDNKPCDYQRTGLTGDTEHCRQENNEDLKEIHHDCFMMSEPIYEPFFSCYNLCKFYASCTKD